MDGVHLTPLKLLFAFVTTVLMVAIMAYLRLSFQQADVKMAIRLMEEAKVDGVQLKSKMDKVLPFDRRLCEASVVNDFQGHMLVTCSDLGDPAHVLKYQVNVIDGMVVPANPEAIKVGKGVNPWSTK